MINDFVNSVVEFTWNSKSQMCIISEISKDGRAICYRVIRKKNGDNELISITDSIGNATGLEIDYRSRFFLPNNYFDKVILKCLPKYVSMANAENAKLLPLTLLEEKYQNLYKRIKGCPPKDTKDERKQLNLKW